MLRRDGGPPAHRAGAAPGGKNRGLGLDLLPHPRKFPPRILGCWKILGLKMPAPVKLGRVPDRVHSLEELFGAVAQMDVVESIVVVVLDPEGCTTLTIDGTTAERMNWMLDRAKHSLHRVD